MDDNPDLGEDGIDAMVLSLSRCVDIDMIVQVCVVYECVYGRLKKMDVMEEGKKEKEKERIALRDKANEKSVQPRNGGKEHIMYLCAEYVVLKSCTSLTFVVVLRLSLSKKDSKSKDGVLGRKKQKNGPGPTFAHLLPLTITIPLAKHQFQGQHQTLRPGMQQDLFLLSFLCMHPRQIWQFSDTGIRIALRKEKRDYATRRQRDIIAKKPKQTTYACLLIPGM